jgi:nicotinamidase-related amidase
MPIPRLRLERAALLVVDLQEKLLPVIQHADQVVAQSIRLIRGCAALGLPIYCTEQYPKGLGATVEPVRAALPKDTVCEPKLKFSACIDPLRKQLEAAERSTVLLCGIEAHVCVMQTALDLLDGGFQPMIVTDAIGSRRPADMATALERMTQAGVVPVTVEMALLELVHEAGTERFKAVLPIIR